MEAVTVATVVSSIGTFISSIVVLFTLIEINKQRKAVYRPDLVFSNSRYFLYWDMVKSDLFPGLWYPQERPPGVTKYDEKLIAVNGFNIGLGAAKSIEIEWEFNIDYFIKQISEKDKAGNFKIEWELQNQAVLAVETFGKKFSINTKVDNHQQIDFVLPSHIDKNSLQIRLPFSYLILTSIIYYLELKSEDCDIPFLPPLRMTVNYTDIGNNRHRKRYELKISPFQLIKSPNPSNGEEVMDGFIEVNETEKSDGDLLQA